MASLKYIVDSTGNFQQGTLGSSYTAGGGTLTLTTGHGARFPSSGDFWVAVDSEIFKVTARSSDTLTVTGGQDGSTNANHSGGVNVTWVEGPSALDQLRTDICGLGTFANLPAAEKAGKLYYTTDSPFICRDNGSSWDYFVNGIKVTPPVTGNFTWLNQPTSATVDGTYGGVIMYYSAVNSAGDLPTYRSTTAFTNSVTVGFLPILMGRANHAYGIFVSEAATGKVITFNHYSNGTHPQNTIDLWTNSTTYSGTTYTNDYSAWYSSPMMFLRIRINGGNRIYEISPTGITNTWIQMFSHASTTGFTADRCGFYAKPEDTGIVQATHFVHFAQT